jgi:cystathionine beta-lyase
MTKTTSFDLDKHIERRGTGCIKWDLFGDDLTPMWVADMDFKSPPAVLEALRERVDHGVFGYTKEPEALTNLIVARMKTLYDWDIEPEAVVYLPGVMPGVAMTARAVLGDAGAYLIQPPVYHPFHYMSDWIDAPKQEAPLTRTETPDGFTYGVDFDAFEAAITPQTDMFLLCNPHNPVGRMWTADEQRRMAEICLEHNVVICSDEIHSDLVLGERDHIPMATLSPEIEANTVTLIAPSKTFNMPGLSLAIAIIPNADLREQFIQAGSGMVLAMMGDRVHSFINMMGTTAAEAAYRDGDEWLRAVLGYLRANHDFARDYIRENMPELKTPAPEGTFLLWIDCQGATLPEPPGEWFKKHAKILMNEGASFGAGGAGFVRMNLACTRDTLESALDAMCYALRAR